MLEAAFTLLGTSVTWLETVAVGFALACVVCEIYEIHWGWPLMIVSSVLYGWLFYLNRLYGDVAVQAYFVLSSLWGWWEWLFGRRASCAGTSADIGLRVARLGLPARLRLAALWLALWPVAGALLWRYTDSDVPWFNGFCTAGSFIGQILTGLKYIECWPVWVVTDLSSAVLYASKTLWLTSILYLVFASLALGAWKRWRGAARAQAQV